MQAAVIKEDKVVNMIYILEANLPEFPNAIDPSPWGLNIGDYTTDGGETWYRDIDGVKTLLPLPEPELESANYEAYYIAE